MKRVIPVFLLFLLAAWGCESIALLPRRDISDDLDRRADYDRRGDFERRGDLDRRGMDRDSIRETTVRNEIIGTVQRIDERRREIQLRTTEGRILTVKYDPDTVVFNRSREMRVDDLNYGDLISVRINSNSRGEQYADVIRMNDRRDVIR